MYETVCTLLSPFLGVQCDWRGFTAVKCRNTAPFLVNILGNHQVSALCEECVNDSQVSGFGKLSVSVGKSCHGGDICQCGGREL